MRNVEALRAAQRVLYRAKRTDMHVQQTVAETRRRVAASRRLLEIHRGASVADLFKLTAPTEAGPA
jgi:hypothetical protein